MSDKNPGDPQQSSTVSYYEVACSHNSGKRRIPFDCSLEPSSVQSRSFPSSPNELARTCYEFSFYFGKKMTVSDPAPDQFGFDPVDGVFLHSEIS